MVEQVSVKGGKEVTEQVEKWKLVCTHTARRTGATLLYLDKWSMDEIALMTGHKKMDKLQIYLKSTARENARVKLLAVKEGEEKYKLYEQALKNNITDFMELKTVTKDALSKFIFKKTKRRPMVLPVVTDV